jgi:hypothetical protein
VLDPGKLFKPSLTFAGKAGAYPNEAFFRCSTLGYAPDFTHKYVTRLEKLARDKHSRLLQEFVTYDSKKSYNICPRCRPCKFFVVILLTLFESCGFSQHRKIMVTLIQCSSLQNSMS